MPFSFEDYQKDVAPKFEDFLSQNQDDLVNQFLKDCFYFIGSLSEKTEIAKKNTEVMNCFNCILLQTLDLSRSLIHAQTLLLLTQSALAYRTLFEIYCNILYITRSANSHVLAQRFMDFGTYEELSGREALAHLSNPSDDEIERLVKKYPDWKSKDKDKKLKTPKNWAPGNMTLKEMAIDLGLEKEFNISYKLNSKFSHCSSVITKLYKRQNTLYLAAETKVLIHNTVPAMMYSLKIMVEYCNYFGIEFELSDYEKLTDNFISIGRRYKGPVI